MWSAPCLCCFGIDWFQIYMSLFLMEVGFQYLTLVQQRYMSL
ncbi:hypothetical protein LINPERPRIM_LOCUS22639 [Linum perenne]